MLTNVEIQRVERDLLRVEQLGNDMTVPFVANKLAGARVAWINERWFLEREIDVTNEDVRRRLARWLIDEYAYLVPLENEAAPQTVQHTKVFAADLYGNSEMATHGGSGRVGISGCFQVKGLGRTPLVGTAVDWLHSHGCLWLEEALREAVYADIAAVEFPHGAVPVLAVIHTGVRLNLDNGSLSEPRALSIRPVVVRPAYLERAILFQPVGQEHAARLRDVRRVRQVVGYLEERVSEAKKTTLQARFEKTFARLARQIAFSRAHRLFPGNYSSSNVGIDGELLDFGAFRALPNWCRYIAMNDVEGFGNERPQLSGTINAISFYVNKYKSDEANCLNPASLQQVFDSELEKACAQEFLRLFHLDDVDDDSVRDSALTALLSYYERQQRVEVRFQNGVKKKLEWFDDVLAAGSIRENTFNPEHQVLTALLEAIRSSRLDERKKEITCRQMFVTAARLLPVREAIVRESLATTLRALILNIDAVDESEATALEPTVNAIIAGSRRHWPHVPRHLLVLAQFSHVRGAVLYCRNLENDRHFLWLEAAAIDDRVWWVDRWLELSAVSPYRYPSSFAGWSGLFPALAHTPVATVAGVNLRLPDSAIWFSTNEQWLQRAVRRSSDLGYEAEVETAGSR